MTDPVADTAPAVVPSSSTSSSLKRKRGSSERKFYAVRIGREPGVYHNWHDCLAQVKGFKKAVFKSFSSLTDAEAFVTQSYSSLSSTNPQKFYAVKSGRVPGVYTDWPSAQDQITGWPKPRHKSFLTRAEAEAFVIEGKSEGSPNNDSDDVRKSPLGFTFGGQLEVQPPATKKRKTAPSKALGKDEHREGEEPGLGPMPADQEDGFDRRIKLDPETGKLEWKSKAELAKSRLILEPDVPGDYLHIYTDGACSSNGNDGAVAGVGVFFGKDDPRNVSEPLVGTRQTNQRAELTALKRALDICPITSSAMIFSDSEYSIHCVTKWFKNWEKNGWVTTSKKPVENKDLIEEVVQMIRERKRGGVETKFAWVKGHANDPGNIAADELARGGANEARANAAR